MSILTSKACRSSNGRLTYIFNEPVHCSSKTTQRVLACAGTNILMLQTPDGQVSEVQNGNYLQRQFHDVLLKARNPHKTYQAQSVIISFDKSEFDTKKLGLQATQALELVQGFVQKYFSDCQSVSAIQADGVGGNGNGDGKLHCHLIINSVKPDGRVVNTNRFGVFRLRKELDSYMADNYERVVGKVWTNPINKVERDLSTIQTKQEWQQQLKNAINQVKSQVKDFDTFRQQLLQRGINVTERGKKSPHLVYAATVIGSRGTQRWRVRDFYQRIDKSTGQVLSTRGLGKDYTRESLEHYWQAMREQTSDLKKKEDNNRESRQYNNEELRELFRAASRSRTKTAEQRESQRQAFRKLVEYETSQNAQQRRISKTVGRKTQPRANEAELKHKGGPSEGNRPNRNGQKHARPNPRPDDGPEP